MARIQLKFKMSDILFMLATMSVLAFPGPSRIKAIFIMAFFGYMMWMKIVNFRKIKNNLHVVGMFLFLGYAFLSKSWAMYPAGVSEQINNVLWTVLLSTAISTYVIVNSLNMQGIIRRLVPIALFFLVNVLLNASFRDGRLSVGINENAFGRLAGGLAYLFLYQSKREGWKNIFMDLLAAVFVLLAFLSGSRASVLIMMICVIAFLFFEHPTKNALKTIGKLLIVAVLAGLGYFLLTHIDFLYSSIGHRFEVLWRVLTGVSQGDGSMISRIHMMQMAREFFLEHPLLGIGLNNFKYATYYHTYAHSNYYELAACLGIVGLLLYYVPLFSYLRGAFRGWKIDKAEMIVPLAILFSFLVGDIGSVSYINTISHVFVGLAVGLIIQHNAAYNPPTLPKKDG